MAEDSDKEELLARLQAHGQNFLSSFGPFPESTSHQPSRKRRKVNHDYESDVSELLVVEDVERAESGSESSGSAETDLEDDDDSEDESEDNNKGSYSYLRWFYMD